MESLIQKAVTILLGLVTTWHWYDKQQRDKRFAEIDRRIEKVENDSNGTKLQIKGVEGEVQALEKTTNLRFDNLEKSNSRIERKIDILLDPRKRHIDEEEA